ncbi:hypothetical protein GTA08_BOTSDO00615 [Neofusicoccum parvum]|uniref:Uncharacterized protein n=1 Tax=Neofusicoccum parvum TaxID=310453 RepID=A0ACB5SCJ3_9PEZI|nr:hypothetical protein GTA08_BOTSDO00615 [Neofusicoccum parvum]GME61705.1 hypothetical protein GTA08_BOTSDO00615 [Neofusicoccum parvum]
MAPASSPTFASPAPNYFSATGGSPPRHHYRRPSLKKTLSPVSPGVSAPRTHCPKDVDAFSFSPSHLPAWSMPQDLWERLPDRLRPHIVGVQHAGAAVLTGFERLKDIRTTLLTDLVELEEPQEGSAKANAPTENNGRTEKELDVLLSNMNFDTTTKGPRARHDSLATPALSTPSLTPPSSEAVSDRSADSSMPGTPGESSPVTPASPPTPISPFSFPVDKSSQSHTPPPTSPISLTSPLSPPPPETPASPATPASIGIISPLRPFVQPPRHPHATYYAAEMAELRCAALVRLRHAARRVDAEWGECKRVGVVRPSERDDDARTAKEFELWWAGRKGAIGALEERIRRIERLGLGLSGFV